MLLAGLRRTYGFEASATGIPEAWKTFVESLPLPGQVGGVTYGAVCGVDMEASAFEYMCAVEVGSFDGLDAATGRMQVPAAKYAVFVHHGPLAEIRQTFATGCEWLDANGEWVDAHTPTFERYGPDFDEATGAGVEVWLPMKPA